MMFLEQDDIKQLTGICRGCKGKTRFQLQIEVLKKMRIPHYVNAAGRPVVARAVIEGAATAKAPAAPKWEPAPA